MKSALQIFYTPENNLKSKVLGKMQYLTLVCLEANRWLNSHLSKDKSKTVAMLILSRYKRVSYNIIFKIFGQQLRCRRTWLAIERRHEGIRGTYRH